MASSIPSLQIFFLLLVTSIAGKAPVHPPVASPSSSTATSLPLGPLLSELGYQELAMAIPSLGSSSALLSSSSPWSPPATIFAPSDDSIRTCGLTCSPSRLLHEHVVPGLFPHLHLSKLAFGTKLETSSPNRCLTITSTLTGSPSIPSPNSTAATDVKIFVDGVEVTRPDLYNDGRIIIHGIQGFIAPLSPFSCVGGSSGGNTIASVMLRDAVVRLRSGGYNILALAMRIKWPELVGLQNMTVFALDDPSIFGGGQGYIHEVRFHVVPNRLLMHSDLARLPGGTVLPTLVKGQNLVVTQGGAGGGAPFGAGLRINYAPIKVPDVVYNSKIVVHGLFFPFPHLYLADAAYAVSGAAAFGGCGASGGATNECVMAASAVPAGAPHAAVAVSALDLDDDDSL